MKNYLQRFGSAAVDTLPGIPAGWARQSRAWVIALALLTASQIRAQSPSFQFASVKPNQSGVISNFLSWNRYAVTAKTANFLIEFAYMRSDNRYGVTLRDDLVVGGPDWVDFKTFDVDAKLEDSQVEPLKQHPNRLTEQMRLRVQSLLADRF